jgi:imidazolonepropionase-like amidohydrolase
MGVSLLTVAATLSLVVAGGSPIPDYAFINGQWFDGEGFRSRTVYSVDGVLSSEKPDRVDSTIDLTGKYVVPPFGEAHNHNVEGSRFDGASRSYLESGIFYIKNPNSLPRTTAELLDKVNKPRSIDVVFAMGGLTASGGHPTGLAERLIGAGVWQETDGEGAFYFTIDTRADLVEKWNSIEAGKPDFIKTYLLYSEEYEKRKDDPKYLGWRGLDPELLPEIVERAHRSGLRVSTHVETAADFRHAVLAGADEINHLPGFRSQEEILEAGDLSLYELSEDDARLAAEKEVVVVTTVGEVLEMTEQEEVQETWGPLAAKMKVVVSQNLRLLKDQGVPIAIGSDRYDLADASEARALHNLGVFSNLELLKMWCETTPATIFPNRKIGHLKDGYEASFLVLDGNPLEDFMSIEEIEMRVKQGQILELDE